jgi:hypothetical protein
MGHWHFEHLCPSSFGPHLQVPKYPLVEWLICARRARGNQYHFNIQAVRHLNDSHIFMRREAVPY